ncbi:MAG: pseudouridine synthase [Microcella sp.]|uniref:pseudouridine synthase n=1 Tax=Microcella sp. TaxID=1913979 RepID=UPI00331636B5
MSADARSTASTDGPAGERLQKVMAAAGVASRRVCEEYIAHGRVTVNGEPVVEPGRRVDPAVDEVALDGVAIQLDTTKRYVMLNKPTGIVSTMSDENGRPDLRRYTKRYDERLYNVGRLDAETSGLLLLTNDGELANVLAHPRFGVEKTYIAKVRGSVTAPVLRRLKEGVELDDGPIAADAARLLGAPVGGHSMVEVTLHSGRNRIVRRMLAAVGHPVVELVRRSFGPLHRGTLAAGVGRDHTTGARGALRTRARAARGGTDTGDAAAAEARSTVAQPDTLDTNPGAPS